MNNDKRINREGGLPDPHSAEEDNGLAMHPEGKDEEAEATFTEEEEQILARWRERRKKAAKKRRRRLFFNILLTVILVIAVFAGGILYVTGHFPDMPRVKLSGVRNAWERIVSIFPSGNEKKDSQENSEKEADGETETPVSVNPFWDETSTADTHYAQATGKKLEKEKEERQKRTKILKKAKRQAEQYDYDAAIKTIKSYEKYQLYDNMTAAVAEYRETKANCVSWPAEKVTHIFYHTLVKDTDKAFDGDYKAGDYNQVMTTIDEFNKITQIMYDKGYVMVSIYDLASVNKDGTMSAGEILLPPGKIPFILSQDDVCYYHYMDGDGFASKLIVDEDGKIRNEYVEDDGSISVGDYDMVPLIDRFVEEHPDFSYRGAKGIVALTGYNGILGYRTDISYQEQPDDLDEVKVKWLEEHPDFDLEEERAGAKEVAEAMKKEGWLFASHTWGHLNVGEISLERLQADTKKFKKNVDPLIGGTDIIIFAFGADLTQMEDYSGEKFEYLKGCGYNYYCNVDSSKYFVQLRDRYFRMGRRNLDGYRMYYNPGLVEDLFDASEVFDKSRPTPVPPMQ